MHRLAHTPPATPCRGAHGSPASSENFAARVKSVLELAADSPDATRRDTHVSGAGFSGYVHMLECRVNGSVRNESSTLAQAVRKEMSR